MRWSSFVPGWWSGADSCCLKKHLTGTKIRAPGSDRLPSGSLSTTMIRRESVLIRSSRTSSLSSSSVRRVEQLTLSVRVRGAQRVEPASFSSALRLSHEQQRKSHTHGKFWILIPTTECRTFVSRVIGNDRRASPPASFQDDDRDDPPPPYMFPRTIDNPIRDIP